jgi:hypothetical protein
MKTTVGFTWKCDESSLAAKQSGYKNKALRLPEELQAGLIQKTVEEAADVQRW